MAGIIKCSPGNKKCGKRCVPQKFECAHEKENAPKDSGKNNLAPPKPPIKARPISADALANSRKAALETPSLKTKLLAIGQIASIGATVGLVAGTVAMSVSAANEDLTTQAGVQSYMKKDETAQMLSIGATAFTVAAASFAVLTVASENQDEENAKKEREKEDSKVQRDTVTIVDKFKEFEASVDGLETDARVAEMYIKSEDPEKTARDLEKFLLGHKASAAETYTIESTSNGEVAVLYDGIKQKQLNEVDPDINRWMY